MSSSPPQEIIDLIIDCLRNEPTALRTCCIVSKSWVSRGQMHLFARVEFHPKKSPIESWMKAFPDPSDSPAHYTRSLLIGIPSLITAANADARAWLRSFRSVARLLVFKAIWDDSSPISFIQLHGFSPILESLSLKYPSALPSEVLNLAFSFPSLQDLSLVSFTESEPESKRTIPSTSPKFTGALSLALLAKGRIQPYACRLLDLPGGLHFSSVTVFCRDGDAEPTADLVSGCSDTMESFIFLYDSLGMPTTPPPIDLSRATKLKTVDLRTDTLAVEWITRTLQTITSKYLMQIAIVVPPFLTGLIHTTVRREWEDLDHVLVQFWTSRSIRPVFKYKMTPESVMGEYLQALLPELASREIVDVAGAED